MQNQNKTPFGKDSRFERSDWQMPIKKPLQLLETALNRAKLCLI